MPPGTLAVLPGVLNDRYWRRRLAGLGVIVLVAAAVAGIVLAAGGGDDPDRVAERYVRAWARGDYAAMYAELTPDAQGRVGRARFAELHREALATATAPRIVVSRVGEAEDGTVLVAMAIPTRVFGTVRATVSLPLAGTGETFGVDWRRNMTFPGVGLGRELRAQLRLPPRATLLTRDGKVLATGPGRTPDATVADVAAQTVGQVGDVPEDRAAELTKAGVPTGSKVGLTGLERALDTELRGTPGGELTAGARVLARGEPNQAKAVRSTIAPSVVRAATAGLAGRLGGVVALDPRDGEILGFAGIPFSGLQPPGSTFKIITLAGALEAGVAKVSDSFPVETAAILEGVKINNSFAESCGGSLTASFAHSCNSVFAPLGAKLGAKRLVGAAEAFGFNEDPGIPGAATSSLPPADEIGDDLALGSTAIGQGRVQATALQMASVAATIARDGRRPELTLAVRPGAKADAPTGERAVPERVARQVQRMMLAVVRDGTGTAAAIPGVSVAGKTGTAELETLRRCDPDEAPPADGSEPDCVSPGTGADPTSTDAWFAAFAPGASGRTPRVAVGVLLVRSGAGGDTAAPVAREVMRAALKR